MAYYSSYDATASATSQHAVRTVKNLLTLLTSSKHLTVHNKRLDCDLAALAALVRFVVDYVFQTNGTFA
jgi:hypothetical protein